ncbi:endo-1,4-beta-xylanase [Rhizocola hellebori]|uniref:endo-1,4-beta-xylanase n=1 Tax=Rhizocola hellebori TaxID=1392758 RepID=UPI001944F7B2|nr:endo-1,4-beta-xylanase [Rhizocola hellebori]
MSSNHLQRVLDPQEQDAFDQAGEPQADPEDEQNALLRMESAESEQAAAAAAEALHLKQAAQGKVRIGSAVRASVLANAAEPAYAQFVRDELDSVTTENELKWDAVEPAQGTFTYGAADTIVDFGQANQLDVRGHTLVWHNALPDWVKAYDVPGEANRLALNAILEQHIRTVVGHYAGRVKVWDVVNEPLADDGTRRSNSMWQRRLGDDYIANSFRWAHEADPGAKLYLNEYGIEMDSAKARSLYELVRGLRALGVPIDGVGFQTHQMLGAERLSGLSNVMRQFADLGLDVAITELDVRIPGVPATGEQLAQQATAFATAVKACLSVPRCVSITTWGFTDKYSWMTNNPDPKYAGWGEATLLDASYVKKPAYNAMLATLATTERPSSVNADLVGAWRLDDWSATTASDASGLDHAATVTGGLGAEGRTPSGSAFRGDGASTGAETASAVVATNASYTVSAWVRLDSKSADQVIVSQDGSTVSAFTLGYGKTKDRWVFSIPVADSTGASVQSVESKSAPVVGEWAHLTAVWNNGWGRMQIYVNGSWNNTFPAASENRGATWASAGRLRIGRSMSGKAFSGAISDVRVYRHAASAGESAGYADPSVGRWQLNGSLADASWFFRDGSVRNDAAATWTVGQGNTTVGALRVSASDYIDIRGTQLLYTERSYTVSALVKLTAAGQSNQIILVQDGNGQYAFVLKYRASDSKWAFGLPASSANSSTYLEIASTSVAQTNWVNLTAVWDGVTRLPKLYVDGILEATGTATTSWPSSPTGSMHLGTSSSSKFDGALDRVQVFQRALTAAEVGALA